MVIIIMNNFCQAFFARNCHLPCQDWPCPPSLLVDPWRLGGILMPGNGIQMSASFWGTTLVKLSLAKTGIFHACLFGSIFLHIIVLSQKNDKNVTVTKDIAWSFSIWLLVKFYPNFMCAFDFIVSPSPLYWGFGTRAWQFNQNWMNDICISLYSFDIGKNRSKFGYWIHCSWWNCHVPCKDCLNPPFPPSLLVNPWRIGGILMPGYGVQMSLSSLGTTFDIWQTVFSLKWSSSM